MKWNEAAEKLSKIEGLMPYEMYKELFDLAKTVRDGGTIFEIGTNKGKSACALACACKSTRTRVYSCDIQDYGAQETARKYGFEPWVTFIYGDSGTVIVPFDEIDMLVVDGNHEYEKVLSDYERFAPMLHKGGILAMDDIYPPGHEKHGICPGPWRVWSGKVEAGFASRYWFVNHLGVAIR